ncbi:PEGA domain-containing protein [Horticoccus luteus]|uniref:PEGA domain-containing protein n=1 Tax=Horticoccus luteus TaxID=2862869 RepID=A0A8F9TWT9_9BACT|nr:PEGA domain-containing protein [Horticoccus luteus]QYM79497.1 PEGA domain-containing protein [Horticoccus luteus]
MFHLIARVLTVGILAAGLLAGRASAAKPGASTDDGGTQVRAALKAAIFVTNRAGAAYDDKLGTLEDLVTGDVTNQGVSVISRETAISAVGSLDPQATENKLDQLLNQSTSAVRLAQTLGADYILQVTLTSVGTKKNSLNAYGVNTTNEQQTVRVGYKILDGSTGASLSADTVKASRSVQQSKTTSEDTSDVVNDLLEEAARKVAVSLKQRIDRGGIAAPTAAATLATLTLRTEAADLVIPDVRIGPDNTVTISESKFKVVPLAASVEVDGIAVGTAPGVFQIRPGLSKIRVVREGFAPWQRTVNVVNDLKLTATLVMDDAGYARWKEATAFLNGLKNDAKLTDAEVKRLEGEARMLEQSGFKVDTKDAPHIEDHRSIFGR